MNAPIKARCWHCNNPLVGPGGSWKARPLYFAEVEIAPQQTVKVHKCCEPAAKESVRKVTAQEATPSPYDLQGDPEYPGE